jgi:hypothetical protein
MRKTGTVWALQSENFKEQKPTIGVDLGDCWSFYCVLDEAGKIKKGGILRANCRTARDKS